MDFRNVAMSVGIFFIAICSSLVYADKTNAVDWNKYAELGDGVYRIQKDNNGIVKSFVVVGSSRISMVLGAVKGEEVARRRARLQAKAEIVKWIKEKVSTAEKSDADTVITLKGDGQQISEQGKSVELSSSQTSSLAEGIVNGTSVIFSKTITVGKEQKYVLILGWSAENVKNAKHVQQIMTSGSVLQSPKTENIAKDKPAKQKKHKRIMLPEKTVVSDEAAGS